jgi:myxalamid-type polyketide synthase MxaE and MxaD
MKIDKDDVQNWLTDRVARDGRIARDQIDLTSAFSSFGLSSLQTATIAGDLEARLGRRIPASTLFEYPTIAKLAAYLTGEDVHAERAAAEAQTHDPTREPIAIVGIGCRFPGAHTPAAFWELLADGRDAVTEVPSGRWDSSSFYDADPQAVGKMVTKWGAFLDRIEQFDSFFFGISPAEARAMDPQQRLLLMTVWEALEDAGQNPMELAGSKTGVFVGIAINEYGSLSNDPAAVDARTGTGNALSIAANRISYFFDFIGPSLAVDTACSSSLVAVHLACASLNAGESQQAVVGGVNLVLTPTLGISFSKAGIMSPEGRCNTFDASANGYVRGEGAGVVVLKRLSAALASRDRIYGVIRGSAVNQDGRSNGLMAPNPRAQEEVILAALRTAGISGAAIQYLEAHGTGTSLGDGIELKAAGTVLGGEARKTCPLAVGSVKTNIGHLEAAAGIAGLIKVALSLKEKRLPRSLHFQRPNPMIPFSELGVRVQDEFGAWPMSDRELIAGVSSFGFGGTNAHVIVAEHPGANGHEATAQTSPTTCLLPISAKTSVSLRALARAYREQLTERAEVTKLAANAAVRRAHFEHRLCVEAANASEMRARLEDFERGEAHPDLAIASPGRRLPLVFVFSGQGTQWVGMGRALAEREPTFAAALRRCASAIERHVDWSLLEELALDAETSRLERTEFAQPVIFAVQFALAELWRSWGIVPDVVIGHSVGEIAAAVAAGALTLEQAAQLVVARGRSMERIRGQGTMLSVALSRAELARRLDLASAGVSVAAINAPDRVVVAGPLEAIAAVEKRLQSEYVTTQRVGVDYAFHTAQLDSSRDELVRTLKDLAPRDGQIKMISTVDARACVGSSLDAAYWARGMREPVDFHGAVSSLHGPHTFVEIGGHAVLARYLSESSAPGSVVLVSQRRDDTHHRLPWTTLGKLYALGHPINWRAVYSDVGHTDLPVYAWELAPFWIETTSKSRTHSSLGHPFLRDALDLAVPIGTSVWTGVIDTETHPYLLDHRVTERAILPAAAYLDLAVWAAQARGWTGPIQLAEIVFEHAFDLEVAKEIQVVGQFASNSATVEVFSRSVGSSAPWIKNASAKLANSVAVPSAVLDREGARQRCTQISSPALLYEALLAHGLTYGPAFRGVQDVARGENEAIGIVRSPYQGKEQGHRLHPAVLDACFHVVAAALHDSEHSQKSFVPAGIERFTVLKPIVEGASSHARLRNVSDQQILADVEICDSRGALLVQIEGLRIRVAPMAPVADTCPRVAVAASCPRVRDAGVSRPEIQENLYEVAWRENEPKQRLSIPRGRWLIFADDSDLSLSLRTELELTGNSCVVVRLPGSKLSSDAVVSATDKAGIQRAVADASKGQRLVGALHLWALDSTRNELLNADRIAASREQGCGSLLNLVQALALEPEPPRLVVVTREAQPVTVGQQVALAQTPVWGIAKGIALEVAEMQCMCIDLDDAGASEGAREILKQLEASDSENQVAVRGGKRYVPRIVASPGLGERTSVAMARPDASYVITGGLGGLGLETAEWLVARGARYLLLLGRSEPSEYALGCIRRMEANGARIAVASADVSRGTELRDALLEYLETAPPLAGAIHAAGMIDDGAILDMKFERVASVMSPKDVGAWALHEVTQSMQLDWFILYSSAVSVLGSPGQANYTAANMFLDALAHSRRAWGLPALSINWGPWAEVGLAAQLKGRMEKRREIATHLVKMLKAERALALTEELTCSTLRQICVVPYDLMDLMQFYPEGGQPAMFAEIIHEDLQPLKINDTAHRLHPRPALSHEYVAPRNALETIVAGIWQRSLGIETVGIKDNFFELGGDSVFAAQVVTQVSRRFGVVVSLQQAFSALTVETLAVTLQDLLLEKVSQLSDEEAAELLEKMDESSGAAAE